MTLASQNGPTIESLYAALPKPLQPTRYTYLQPEEVPEPFHHLLVHDRHMTVAMETHYGCRVQVRVLQRQTKEGWYARQIVLINESTGRIVQGGVVRIHLHMLDDEVQQAILRENTPLGYVLIHHEVMRHIEVLHYIRMEASQNPADWPGFDQDHPVYGRLATLHCDGQPAIELLEIIPS